jgi:hypothetical protein
METAAALVDISTEKLVAESTQQLRERLIGLIWGNNSQFAVSLLPPLEKRLDVTIYAALDNVVQQLLAAFQSQDYERRTLVLQQAALTDRIFAASRSLDIDTYREDFPAVRQELDDLLQELQTRRQQHSQLQSRVTQAIEVQDTLAKLLLADLFDGLDVHGHKRSDLLARLACSEQRRTAVEEQLAAAEARIRCLELGALATGTCHLA